MKAKYILLVFLFLLVKPSFCDGNENSTLTKYNLNKGWQFKQQGKTEWLPASVPGSIHTDLLDNKLIPDPYFGTNEKDLQWIGQTDWDYKTDFILPDEMLKKNNIELVFEGLDTYADVYLNDSLVLSADNMFRTWKVNCKGLLKVNNVLSIHFNNVFKVNLPKWENAPFRLMAFSNNDQADTMIAMYSRKAQFHYGWDWGPRLITCGVWRNVYINAWNDFKISNVQVVQKNVSKEKADINSVLNLDADKYEHVNIKVLVDNKEIASKESDISAGSNHVNIDFTINNPELWWTNGLGSHYLYNFKYVVSSTTGKSDSKEYNIGIRSLEVVREKDSMGKSFYVKLNGVPVFMKGANYIPQDNFQNRVTHERFEHMIKSAADANMNMLRVWGGGIYENDEFYDLCDKYGILVWQEFGFACAMYPADSAFLNSVKHEVIDNVTRLRNHPAIVMYCGNNENEIGWDQWGWKYLYSIRERGKYESDMHKLFYETIPDALKECDTTRYYHYSSPSAGFKDINPNEGDIHYWGVWHGNDPFEDYNTNIARFVSEYGFQSYPELNSVKKFVAPMDMQLHSEVMLSHQRCMANNRKDREYGNMLIQTYMDRQYNIPKDFASYLYVSQVLQAEGVKTAIEAHRRNMPYCMGTMYWQLDDCWPVASWSGIDYYGNWKALHYYVKREFGTFIISNMLNNDSLNFYIVSDSLQNVTADLFIKCIDFNAKVVSDKVFKVHIAANSSKDYIMISEDDLIKDNDKSSLVVLSQLKSGDKLLTENAYFFNDPKKLKLEKPEIKVNAVKTGTGYEISLTSAKYAKDVYLSFDDYTDGFFSDNYFDLLPGRIYKINFKTDRMIDDFTGKLKVVSLVDSY